MSNGNVLQSVNGAVPEAWQLWKFGIIGPHPISISSKLEPVSSHKSNMDMYASYLRMHMRMYFNIHKYIWEDIHVNIQSGFQHAHAEEYLHTFFRFKRLLSNDNQPFLIGNPGESAINGGLPLSMLLPECKWRSVPRTSQTSWFCTASGWRHTLGHPGEAQVNGFIVIC